MAEKQNDPNLKLLGLRLENARRARHFTRDYLSEQCHITSVHLRHIENGSRLPSLPVFISLCNALSVSPTYILSDYVKLQSGLPDAYDRAVSLLYKVPPNLADVMVGMLESTCADVLPNEVDCQA